MVPIAKPLQTRIVTEKDFIVKRFSRSDYKQQGSGEEEVKKPHQYEDATKDNTHSIKSTEHEAPGSTIGSGIKKLHFDNSENERQALKEVSQTAERLRRMRLSSGQESTVNQSIGSETEDGNLRPVELELANHSESGARRLRGKFEERASLMFDDPPPTIDEVGEESESCEDVNMTDNEEDEGCQTFGEELPHYGGPSSIRSGATYEDCPPGFTPRHQPTNEASNLTGANIHMSDPKLAQNTLQQSKSPSQNSSIADSSFSEDATDWEGSEAESYVDQDNPSHNGHVPQYVENQLRLCTTNLEPIKRGLLDRLMDYFWIYFNQNWPTDVRQHPGAANDCQSASRPPPSSKNKEGKSSGKRNAGRLNGDGGDDENPEGDSNRDLGGSSKRLKYTQGGDQSPGFACPYRKHDPRKYCVSNWRSCALNPQKTVARVK
jgi:hypothetical protein